MREKIISKIVSFLKFRKSPSPQNQNIDNISEKFIRLRNMVFGLRNLKESPLKPNGSGLFAALIEEYYGNSIVSLIAVSDGSASLYFSTGGGYIGGGTHEAVKKQSTVFLDLFSHFQSQFSKTDEKALPEQNFVKFSIVSTNGIYENNILKEKLLNGDNEALFKIYAQGQNVISQLRLINTGT